MKLSSQILTKLVGVSSIKQEEKNLLHSVEFGQKKSKYVELKQKFDGYSEFFNKSPKKLVKYVAEKLEKKGPEELNDQEL